MNTQTLSKIQYYLLFCLILGSLTANGQDDVFFSEYLENGRNKCLELFNPTKETIDLSDYTIEVYVNGSSSQVGTPWSFAGRTIGPMSVIVLCQGLSDINLLSIRDYPFGFGNFNGDDAIVLKNNGQIIDIIGKVGCDPGTSWSGGGNKTEDVVLIRNACVSKGITNSGGGCSTFNGLATDWTSFSKTDYSNLGSHTFGLVEVEIFGKNALCEQTEIILTATEGFKTYRWSNGSNSRETTISQPGTYTVTVTTTENCTAKESKTINGKSPEIFAEITNIKDVSCLPKSDGGFRVSPRGGDGSGIFTYQWENGSSNSANITGVTAGDYNVTIMDNNGCSVVKEVTIGGTTTFSMNTNTRGETCKGRGDGSISISTSGTGIRYSLDGEIFQNNGFFDNVLPGTYNVLAIDNSGCGNQERVTVNGGTRFDLRNSVVSQAKCQGEGGGQIILVPEGGKAPYTVSFDGGPFNNQKVFSDLKGDTFDIKIRDASGCEKDFKQIIDEGSDLLVTGYELTPATCAGIDDGGIRITTLNGSGNFSYSMINDRGVLFPYFSPNFENLSAGPHTILVRDNPFDCIIPLDFDILEETPLLTNIINAAPCGDDQKGKITVLPQTGFSPYTYSLDTGAFKDTNIFLDLEPMDYIVTTKDSLGCIKVDSVSFNMASGFEIQSVTPRPETCVNRNDGQIAITTNGTGTVAYSLDNITYTDSQLFSGLAPRNYTVYAKSETCIDSALLTILPATPITLLDTVAQLELCEGNNDGQLTINVSGGQAPYEYKLNNGAYQTDVVFSGLAQGIYELTVKDANLCEQVFTNISLDGPTRLTASCVVSQQVSTKDGNDGAAQVTIVGGIAPYNVQLINTGFNNMTNSTGVESFNNIPAGDYLVSITDFNGCSTTCSFKVDEPQCDFNIDNTKLNATCFEALDGAISLILPAEDALRIDWSDAQYNGAEQLTGLAAGTYGVTVTNQVDCADSLQVTISEPLALSVEIVADNLTICENDVAQLTLTDTYTQYNWSNASTNAITTVSEAGTYQVTVRNEDDCIAMDDITINVIPQDTFRDSRYTCDEANVGTSMIEEGGADGCIDIVFRTFELARRDTTALFKTTCNPTETGMVRAVFSNTFGCDSIVITTTSLLRSDTIYQMNISCNSDEVGVRREVLTNAVGCDSTLVIETTLEEDLPQFFRTQYTCNPMDAGVDTTFLKTLVGCDSLVITQTISNASDLTNVTATTCNIDEIGIDTFFLTNQFLCDSLVVLNTSLVPSDFVSLRVESCNPADIGLSIQNLTNQFGCDSTVETSTVFVPISECRLDFSLKTDTVCWNENQGIIRVSITDGMPPFDYYVLNDIDSEQDTIQRGLISRNDEEAILKDIPIGEYTIVLVNSRGVRNQKRITIRQAAEIIVDGLPSDYAGFAVSCKGETDGSIELNISGGQAPYTYLWADGAQSGKLENLAEGSYSVTVTDANGCEQYETFDLFSAGEVAIDFQSFSPRCFGDIAGSIIIYDLPNANGGVEYSLDGVLFEPIGTLPFTIENLPPKDYQLFVQDENDCQASALFSVPMPNDNQLTLGDTKNLKLGDSLTLIPKANFEIDRLEWTATVPLVCEDCLEIKTIPTQNGQYTLTAYDANGCKEKASTTVNLRKERQVYLPNVFSPNSDGQNDEYQVMTGNSVKLLKRFSIFDYEGRRMYQVANRLPNDASVGWNGQFNGQKMQPGVFVVFVEVELLDGTTERYQQTMTLIK